MVVQDLFGLKAPVIKAHGSSDANAIYNAIRQAKEMVNNEVPQTIAKTMRKNTITMNREKGSERMGKIAFIFPGQGSQKVGWVKVIAGK